MGSREGTVRSLLVSRVSRCKTIRPNGQDTWYVMGRDEASTLDVGQWAEALTLAILVGRLYVRHLPSSDVPLLGMRNSLPARQVK